MRAIFFLLAAVLFSGCNSQSDSGAAPAAKGDRGDKTSAARVTAVSSRAGRASSDRKIHSSNKTPEPRAATPLNPPAEATTCPLVEVSGRVLFENGTPLNARISTATVELWQELSENGVARDQRLSVSGLSEKGAYRVSGPDGWNLRVEVKGVSRAVADLPFKPFSQTTATVRRINQDFRIPEPHRIIGRVIDTKDQPVTSAVVSLRSKDVITDGWYYGNQQTTVTAAGEFVLEGVAEGEATLGAAAPGYAPFTQEIAAPTSGPITLRLTTGTATVTGQVLLFPNDTPVGGATVKIEPKGDAKTLRLTSALPPARTAADGSFTLQHLSAGPHTISVLDSAGKELYPAPGKSNRAAMEPVLVDEQSTALAVRVFPGHTITGRVYDQETSDSLSGAEVVAFLKGAELKTTSDSNGAYKLERVGSTATVLGARLAGFAIASGIPHFSPGTYVLPLKLPEDSATLTMDLPMVPVIGVSGHVENQEGLPVPGAKVEFISATTYDGGPQSVTDADGRFRFESLPFQDFVLEVTADGYAFKQSEARKAATEDIDDIVIVLSPGASIEGRVVSPSGDGVADASLQVDRGFHTVGGNPKSGTVIVGKTGVGGVFSLESLEAGDEVKITATAGDFAPGEITLKLSPGEHKGGVEIRLKESLTVEGHVLDDNDKPVNATVYHTNTRFPTFVRTDQRGLFKLGGLDQGPVTVRASSEDTNHTASVQAQAGDKNVIIRLNAAEKITLHGKVVDSTTGRPIDNFTLEPYTVERAGEGPGGFRLTRSARDFLFRLSAENYVPQTFRVAVKEGEREIHQTFKMSTGSGVTGRVVDTNDKPMPGIAVAAYEGNGYGRDAETPSGSSVSGADGKFTLSRLPPTRVRVAAVPNPPLAPSYKVVNLEDGAFEDIGDLKIEQFGGLRIQVVRGETKEPVNAGTVMVEGVGEQPARFFLTTNADGVVDQNNLSPGTYNVASGGREMTAEVKAGETHEGVLELGHVTMTGKVESTSGTKTTRIHLRNTATGETGRVWATPTYKAPSLSPGNYEVTITPYTEVEENQTTTTQTILHQEQVTVPDQPEFTKDFLAR